MATPFKIDVPSTETGLLNWKQTEASAKKATELLQKDLDVSSLLEAIASSVANIASLIMSSSISAGSTTM